MWSNPFQCQNEKSQQKSNEPSKSKEGEAQGVSKKKQTEAPDQNRISSLWPNVSQCQNENSIVSSTQRKNKRNLVSQILYQAPKRSEVEINPKPVENENILRRKQSEALLESKSQCGAKKLYRSESNELPSTSILPNQLNK